MPLTCHDVYSHGWRRTCRWCHFSLFSVWHGNQWWGSCLDPSKGSPEGYIWKVSQATWTLCRFSLVFHVVGPQWLRRLLSDCPRVPPPSAVLKAALSWGNVTMKDVWYNSMRGFYKQTNKQSSRRSGSGTSDSCWCYREACAASAPRRKWYCKGFRQLRWQDWLFMKPCSCRLPDILLIYNNLGMMKEWIRPVVGISGRVAAI